MSTKNVTLHDENGNTLLPATKTSRVTDANGTNLDTLLQQAGQVKSISVNGVAQTIDSNGNVNITSADGVGIASVVQTTTSTEDGGTNVITVTKTDNTTSTFSVKNGSKGSTGATGPQGERGLPGESGVTGDVSGFTVHQTINPSTTYGATDIAGAATVQATNAELTELEGQVIGFNADMVVEVVQGEGMNTGSNPAYLTKTLLAGVTYRLYPIGDALLRITPRLRSTNNTAVTATWVNVQTQAQSSASEKSMDIGAPYDITPDADVSRLAIYYSAGNAVGTGNVVLQIRYPEESLSDKVNELEEDVDALASEIDALASQIDALTIDTKKGYIGSNNKFTANANSGCYVLKVTAGLKYRVSIKTGVASTSKYCLFTSDFEGQSSVGNRFEIANNVFVAPNGAEYFYVCYNYDGNGSDGDVVVEEYNFVKETTDNTIVQLSEMTEYVQGKNIYDYETVGTVNGLVSTSGDITTAYGGFSTGLIPVLPNHFYYLTRGVTNLCIVCLGANKTTKYKVLAPSTGTPYETNYRLPNVDGSSYTSDGCGQFKTPPNAAYLRFSLTNINVTELGEAYKIMLEDVGESYNEDFIPSDYEPWQDPTLKIKNDFIIKDTTPTKNSKKPIESGAVYEALKNVEYKAKLSVLLIGSSHGVNTISMFPALANHVGINITVGNLYTGSATLGLYRSRPHAQIPYLAKYNANFDRFALYENGEWTTKSSRTVSYALSLYKWDVIILQRGASENTVWDEEKSNYYQYMLDYIKEHCYGYTPKIYFNSGIANAIPDNSSGRRESQINQTNSIISSARQMKSEYGIDIIPTAVAVQYARSTCLKDVGQYTYKDIACDSQHLDTGIGQYITACTVFEKIVGDILEMSIRELAYYPVYDDVSGNVVNSGSQYFTAITDYYSSIAKQCAMLAVVDKEYVAEHASALANRYASLPTTYNITNNLTGCTNNNSATSISSDNVYLAKLFVNSGLTMQSVVVTMGGEDITDDAYVESYVNGSTTVYYYAIRIGVVTGNIVITAIAS